MNPHALDRRAARRAFAAAAAGYDAAAALQQEVAARLLERLELIRLQPARVLDLGCGTGQCAAALAARWPQARIVALDAAAPMLTVARARGLPDVLAADAQALPLASGSTDLVLSNLMLQWCEAPAVFAEVMRVLRPGGLWLFSTFGPDTLGELRAAWAQADAGAHVHAFTDLHDLGDQLLAAGFADAVMDAERLTLSYGSLDALLAELKALGAANALSARARGLSGKTRWRAMRAAYERWRGADGRYPATHELLFGHAWRPAADGFEFRLAGGQHPLRRAARAG